MPSTKRPRFRLADLAARLGVELIGDGDVEVAQVAPLDRAGDGEIAFLASARYRRELAASRAAAVIVGPGDRDSTERPRLVASNPYACYARVVALLNPILPPTPGIDPRAAVDPTASVAASASVGAFAVVGARAVIEAGAVVCPGAVVGADATIGADSRIDSNATVRDGCVLGRRAVVHSGAVIGADGFGMADDGGRWIKIPQIGRVVIGDDVEVGACTTIDRGALDDTVIEDGVKLDNLIQIAHNCRIGAHSAIAGCVGIAGSARIGRHCRIGGAAMIAGHLEIADGTVISGGTLVAGSIREPGTYTGVFPTMPHTQWLHVGATLRQLRHLAERVRMLERQLESQGD